MVKPIIKVVRRALDAITPETQRGPYESITRAERAASDEFLDLLMTNPRAVTPEIFDAANARPAQRAYVDQNYDLDLSTQARNERADQYWPETYYHGTEAAPYGVPLTTRDGGFHMGSPEAATDRLRSNANMGPIYSTGGNPDVPSRADLLDSLDVLERDLGGNYPVFYDPSVRQFLSPEEAGFPNARAEMMEGSIVDPGDTGMSAFVNRQDALEGLGFDLRAEARGMREGSRVTPYRVNIENPLEMDVDPSQWSSRSIAAALDDQRYIRADAGEDIGFPEQLMHDLRALSTRQHDIAMMPPEIRRELGYAENNVLVGADDPKGLPLTQRFMEEAQDMINQYGYDGIRYINPYEGRMQDPSVIAFRPQQVREALAARFDPRLRHLPNALAGVAGAAVLPYGMGSPTEER